jgi:hypothetical protein
MVSVEAATALCDPFRTAMAWTVAVAAIEIAPVYGDEELVGTVPSVV